MQLSLEKFEDLVQQAIELLPPDFSQYLNEVPVVIQDRPDEQLYRELHLDEHSLLLGLFRGQPLTNRTHFTGGYPSQIFLYRLHILECCRSEAQVRNQVQKTLIHELGHYLGFSEKQLRNLHY